MREDDNERFEILGVIMLASFVCPPPTSDKREGEP